MSKLRVDTVKRWLDIVDPQHSWLRWEDEFGFVKKIYCELCRNQKDKLRAIRNYNAAFCDGITGTSLKKDNAIKHSKTEMHKKAVNLKNKPTSLAELYKCTPLGKAVSGELSFWYCFIVHTHVKPTV